MKDIFIKFGGWIVGIIGLITFGYLKGKSAEKDKQRKGKEKNDKELKKIRKNARRDVKSTIDSLHNNNF